ncbi:unnamed protein product [Phyllotreta striolata]|uniref:Uncharacterized protein n=1 Tax=Phyllotreta striolata TaxID=444603 RepID=A0A9N9U281_PHYSR|nr:unnamed protein product [Phyllotreta striolata]
MNTNYGNKYFERGDAAKKSGILSNYFVIQDPSLLYEDNDEQSYKHEFFAYQEPPVVIPEPKAAIWEFLSKTEMQELLKCKNSTELKKYLNSVKLEKFCPKGKARTVFIDLMLSVAKFCFKQRYTLEKSAALMSQYYLTHLLVVTSFHKSTEKVYNYYKELSLCYTLPTFPPKFLKLFSMEETKKNMVFFCIMYLRNLPLIRFLCLPNFGFHFNYFKAQPEKSKFKKSSQRLGKQKSKFKSKLQT